jgi:glycosyltransferase involved in cell wall biosynthesis
MATLHGWTGHSVRERFFYYPAEKLIVRGFPLVVAVSSQIRDTLIKWGGRPERIRVVPNGIDPDEFRRDESVAARARELLGVQRGDVVVGSAGRLELQKRFDVLLEATKLLLPRRPQLRLFIAGEGSLRSYLDSRIRQLGIADRCRLLGHRPDMREMYHAFDVLVQSSDYEGTPTVLVEAMALRIPVVATDVGGTSELVRDGIHGLLVPPRNPGALANAVERTLDDRDATARRVTAARTRVEGELSFDARMRKMEEIYRELARERDRRRDARVR